MTDLLRFLSEKGLNVKWLHAFQRKGIKKPNQILAVEGNEVYQSLSLDATPDEKQALREILHIKTSIASPDDNLSKALRDSGLDISYWLSVFEKQLGGVKSMISLQYVGQESFQLLTHFVTKTHETKSLRQLFKLESGDVPFKKQRQNRRDKLEKQLAESKRILAAIENLSSKGETYHNKDVQEAVHMLCEVLQFPENLWQQSGQVIGHMKAVYTITNAMWHKEELSEIAIVTNSSNGLTLRGILITGDANNATMLREKLLNPPKDIHFHAPFHSQYDIMQHFSSKEEEEEYSKQIIMLGYTSSGSEKEGFWKIGFEDSTGCPMSETKKHHSKMSYISTVMYSFIPLVSCSFEAHQLQLSDNAKKYLRKIESATSKLQSVQQECEEFFAKFGSHACQGPFHFGGVYKCKIYTAGFLVSDEDMVLALQKDAISTEVGLPCGSIADGVAASNSSINFCEIYSEALTRQTFKEVTITGGPPEATDMLVWKNGLVASNSTWHLIDRGTDIFPVWDIVEKSHASEFKNSSGLGETLKQAWKVMNKLHLKPSQSNEVKSVMDSVNAWNETPNESFIEQRLVLLIQQKEKVAKMVLNPQVWARDYLSQIPLQHFLRSIADACRDASYKNSDQLKRNIRQLVEPIDLCTTSFFLNEKLIHKWLYDTEELTPPLQYQDFFSMNRYFKLALGQCEISAQKGRMITCGMSAFEQRKVAVIYPDIIKASSTVTHVVMCLRNYLQKAGQHYEDCFVTTLFYPFGYNPGSNRFLISMTARDIEYICEHFESDSKDFFRKKKKSLLSSQAYLFSLMIQLYNIFDVSEAQVKCHLQYLMHKIKLEPTISDCITGLESKGYDWEWFQHELDSIAVSTTQNQDEGGVPLGDIFAKQEVKNARTEIGTPKSPLKDGGKMMTQLFQTLHLLDYFPQKLSLSHAMEVREDTLEVVKPHSLARSKQTPLKAQKSDTQQQIQCTNPQLYPFLMIQKIMAFDSRCRMTLTFPSSDKMKKSSSDSDDSDSDDDDHHIIHPMDGLLALLHCSDNFLRQNLMNRLATCQLAIPLLLPDPITQKPIFLLWALRSIVKEFCLEDGTTYTGPIVDYPAPIVSFLRIGDHDKSKSRLLNTVINTTEHAPFFHYDSDGGRAERALVPGLVEVSWYLPSKCDTLFPNAITFANLHGDARNYMDQIIFLSKTGCMHFVLLKEVDVNDKTIEVLKYLSQASGGLVILNPESVAHADKKLKLKIEQSHPEMGKLSMVPFFKKNDAEIKKRIQKIIRKNLPERTDQTLETVAYDSGIVLDEAEPACIEARKLAGNFLTLLQKFKTEHPGQSPKSLLVLQSSDFWQKVAIIDKEQYRHRLRGHTSMSKYGEIQRNKMNDVRKNQLYQVQKLSQLMSCFLTTLLTQKGPKLWYYMKWISLFLDNLSRELLPPLLNRYQEKRKELNDIQMQEKKDETRERISRVEMDDLNMELVNASFGLEHLLREVSQMYEAVVSQEDAPLELKEQVSRLPEIAAQLLVDGFPLELMDGDAAHVPIQWISEVLKDVEKLLKKYSGIQKPQIFVLSVLGLQSTGKSTMLNSLFGVQFSVSAGRCTRGAFMQLLPVHKSLQKECGFQYFLIIDTEGLRAPELDALATQKHDNELATFVIGMANHTIMNIKGEIAGDMDDILQTSVHAFLRMKEVNLNPSCHFVHQNVPAITAGEKAMAGRFKVKDKLDKMTAVAAKEAGLGDRGKYFSDVIKFDYEKDVSFFPSLWTGSPPMAAVSTRYSVEAQTLKCWLIHFAGTIQKNRDNSVLQLREHLKGLWGAILSENFVFSFKNSFEIAAYKTLEEHFSDLSWSFKKAMTTWERGAQNKLQGCPLSELPKVSSEVNHSLLQHIDELHEANKTKMNIFFEESSEQEIISKWKGETERKLENIYDTRKARAKSLCSQLFNARKGRAKVDVKKKSLSVSILKRVQQLVSSLKKGELDDKQLKDRFEESWIGWIEELKSEVTEIPVPDVKNEVEKCVTDLLAPHHTILVQKLAHEHTGKPLEKWGSSLTLKIQATHLKPPPSSSSSSSWGRKLIDGVVQHVLSWIKPVETYFDSAQQDTKIILKKVSEYLRKKRSSEENFNPEFTTEMLIDLLDNITQNKSDQFHFTAEYRVDMALTACGYAIRVFEEMAESYRKRHDPLEYIESEMKPHCLKLFMDQYKKIAQEKTTAQALCQKLKEPITHYVLFVLNSAIADDMRLNYPWIKVKRELKAHILLDIGENLENYRTKKTRDHNAFDDCWLYLKEPRQSLKHWIKHYTDKRCDSNSPSRISVIALDKLSMVIKTITLHAEDVTMSFSSKKKQKFCINDWFTKFHNQVQEMLTVDLTELCVLGGNRDFEDVDFFASEFAKGLIVLHQDLKHDFSKVTSSVQYSQGQSPYDDLFEEVAGCTEQCPFCKEQCDHTMENHTKNVQHAVQHRPECLGGTSWEGDNTMSLDICTFSVASDCCFRNEDTNKEWRPYKEYRSLYPQWSIPADQSLVTSLFWKWLVGNFSTEIENYSSHNKTEIPAEWRNLKWSKVKEWIKEEYKV